MAAISLEGKSDKNGLLRYDGAGVDDELVVVARLRCVETGERDAEGSVVEFSKWKAYEIEAVPTSGSRLTDRRTVVELLAALYAERTGKQTLPIATPEPSKKPARKPVKKTTK